MSRLAPLGSRSAMAMPLRSLVVALVLLLAVPLAARSTHHALHHRRARRHAHPHRLATTKPLPPGTIALRFCDQRSRKGVAVFLRIVPSGALASPPAASATPQTGAQPSPPTGDHPARTSSTAAQPVFAQTGEDGRLRIALPAGRYTLEAAAPGYRPVTVEWKPDSTPDEILLTPEYP